MAELLEGVYDLLVTRAVREALGTLPSTLRADTFALCPQDAVEYLAREVASRVRNLLKGELPLPDASENWLGLANKLLESTGDSDPAELQLLSSIHPSFGSAKPPPRIPMSQSALITNDQGLNYHSILRSELGSADRVDLICPFIGNQGLNLIVDLLHELGSRLRVITTTYLGGTHARALERLAASGAQIKIAYERPSQKTSLHAKAWIFHRQTGFTTATIGSSNLSPKALVDGLEWNVRVGANDCAQVLRELEVTFERLWRDPAFETFDPARDVDRLRAELRAQRQGDESTSSFFADLVARPHQQEALDALRYARLDGRHQNLVVAATGTGKTLLAAFDYERFCRERGGRPRLLFVAHREDILKQSLDAFRAVMRDGNFGELNVGSYRAESWNHVFASVQSLAARNLSEIRSDHFDYVVIDEFHHAEAPTYLRILDHFSPAELLGLTATPERADGRNVIDRFGTPTYELRLWHALERKLLCPFHYFGVDDGTDLASLRWKGKYEDEQLNEVFVERGRGRAALIIRELKERTEDTRDLRAVAFCATILHAKFMAQCFIEAGIEALALHSEVPKPEREIIVQRFRSGLLPVICTVDLFNEGIDIPEINTVLFLRPTESSTVFIQQLGRGLRNHYDKGALTVLDFVGNQNKKFRMDLRYRAMTGQSRVELGASVREGFPMLPPGCDIRLDAVTRERVLQNLRQAIPSTMAELAVEYRRLSLDGDKPTVGQFLRETGLEPSDLYRTNRSLSQVRKAAFPDSDAPAGNSHRIGSLTHVDDKHRLRAYAHSIREPGRGGSYERMMAFPLHQQVHLSGLDARTSAEVAELFEYLSDRAPSLPLLANDLPFALHAHYSRDEIVAPFRDNPQSMRQGTFQVAELGLDIHIVTLKKSERDFSPTTRYQDYFESPDTLHWESQSTTSVASATGQRLVAGIGRHLFFARAERDQDGRPSPFLCLGFGTVTRWESEKPIRILWKLEHAVPDHIYVRLAQAAG